MESYTIENSHNINELFDTTPTQVNTPKTKPKTTRQDNLTSDNDNDNEINDLLKGITQEKKPVKQVKKKPVKVEKDTLSEKKIDVDTTQQNEDETKQAYIQGLSRYGSNERFGKYLKNQGFSLNNMAILGKKSTVELESLMNRVRFCVNTKNTTGLSDTLLQKLFLGSEAVITNKSNGKVNLTGLQAALWANDEFLDLLEQFSLEYLTFCNIDYRLKLAGIVFSTAIKVHAMNSHFSNQNNTPEPEFNNFTPEPKTKKEE
jgi:hypothetical protein